MSSLLDKLNYGMHYLMFSFGAYEMAEVRQYAEPDAKYFSEYRASWVDFWGDPYSYLLNNGSWDVPSGWVDVAGCSEIDIRIHTQGSDPADTGLVTVTFETGESVVNSFFNKQELVLTGSITGTTEKRTSHVVAVGPWRYIRVYTVVNPSANPVSVRVTSTSAVHPIKAGIMPGN